MMREVEYRMSSKIFKSAESYSILRAITIKTKGINAQSMESNQEFFRNERGCFMEIALKMLEDSLFLFRTRN